MASTSPCESVARRKELGPEPWALDGEPIEVRLPAVLDDKAESEGASTLTAGEDWLKTEIVGAQSRAESKGEHAIYADALPGVDVDLSAIPTGLKETLTLVGPKATSDFSYVISLSDGLVPKIDSSTGMIVVEGPSMRCSPSRVRASRTQRMTWVRRLATAWRSWGRGGGR